MPSSQSAGFRASVYAAPFDSLLSNGLQTNGSMDVSQENGTTQITLATGVAKYIVDQYQGYYTHAANTAVIKCQQVTPPGSPAFGGAFQNCFQMTATTALSSPATGDFAALKTYIEGNRWARLSYGSSKAKPVTIGFWVYATIPGIMTFTLANSTANRSYPVNINIYSATTWEFKTVTIPGDVTGSWETGTGAGVLIYITFCAGSTYYGNNAAWNGTALTIGTATTTNFFATNNNTVCLTGLGVFPGTEAPNAERSPFIMRPFDQEIDLAQRFYFITAAYGTPRGAALGGVSSTASLNSILPGAVSFRKVMRGTPTMQAWQNGTQNQAININAGGVVSLGTPTFQQTTVSGYGYIQASGTPFAAGTGYAYDAIADARY